MSLTQAQIETIIADRIAEHRDSERFASTRQMVGLRSLQDELEELLLRIRGMAAAQEAREAVEDGARS